MNKQDEKIYDDNDEDFTEDRVYDETMQDQETDSNKVKVEFKRKLMEIPNETLPCPYRQIHSEESYSPPTQDEVRSFKTSDSNSVVYSVTITLISFVVSIL